MSTCGGVVSGNEIPRIAAPPARARFDARLPRWLACLVVACTLSGCMTPDGAPTAKKFTASDVQSNMSLAAAKRTIQRWARWHWSDGAADHAQLAFQFEPKQIVVVTFYPSNNTKRIRLLCEYEKFAPETEPPVELNAGTHKGRLHSRVRPLGDEVSDVCGGQTIAVPTEEAAKEVAAAFLRWKSSTFEERAAFLAQEARVEPSMVATYASAGSKPGIPEEVRRFAVVANVAVREKRFADAVAAYEDALDVAPWWGQGHFNAALVLAEIYHYRDAVNHLKKYLALTPGAPDARQAQDKIYEWEDALRVRT